jgi:hypothetical protein
MIIREKGREISSEEKRSEENYKKLKFSPKPKHTRKRYDSNLIGCTRVYAQRAPNYSKDFGIPQIVQRRADEKKHTAR